MKCLPVLAFALFALAAHGEEANPKRELNEARYYAWGVARSSVETLRRAAARQPAFADWIAEFDRAAIAIDRSGPPQRMRPLNADALAGRNPKFWRALHAAPPSDPSMLTLHAALLLAGGEATRARYVIALATQHPQLSTDVRETHRQLALRAETAARPSRSLVLEGLQWRARRDFPATLEKLAEALVRWPQNAAAHWEVGRTLREQAWDQTRKADVPDAPEVVAAFERARQHDPLLIEAYQGSDPVLRKRLMALLSTQGTAWLRIGREPDRPAETAMLVRFASALQNAGADELALACYQAVRARRGASEADQQFIAASLRAIGDATSGQTAP